MTWGRSRFSGHGHRSAALVGENETVHLPHSKSFFRQSLAAPPDEVRPGGHWTLRSPAEVAIFLREPRLTVHDGNDDNPHLSAIWRENPEFLGIRRPLLAPICNCKGWGHTQGRDYVRDRPITREDVFFLQDGLESDLQGAGPYAA